MQVVTTVPYGIVAPGCHASVELSVQAAGVAPRHVCRLGTGDPAAGSAVAWR